MPPHHRPHVEAAEALATVAPMATRWIERLLAQGKPPLTVTQYLALRAIALEGTTGGELARRAGVSGPAVSQLLSGLVEAGLIERRPLAADRRRQELAVSAAGESALQGAIGILKGELGTLLVGIPKPEVDALARLLWAVEAVLSGKPPPPRPAGPPAPPPKGPPSHFRPHKP